MKRQIIETYCDRCGEKIDNCSGGWFIIERGLHETVGIKAFYSDCGVGKQFDLCKKCTLKIAKEFIDKEEGAGK